MVFGSITTIGQTIECQAKDRTDSPPPIGYRNQPLSAMDWKCVKVKFHILDNDGLPITDQQIYDRLQEINRYFEPGNIRLVLYDACIQRLQISENVTDIDITNSLQSGSSLYEYDSSALNIYVLNSTQPGACSFAKAIYDNTVSFRYSFHCSWNHSPEVFAHEIGHVIGNLGHTFAVETKIDSITGELTYLNVECKDRTNCQTAGDYICQTGADPYAMDLNDNNIPDVFDDTLHVDTSSCQQILTNEPGECMPYDSSTYWDIPFRNLMSYYNNCYEEFVEEQYLEMHMKLDNDPEVSNFIIDCDDLDIQNPQTNVQDIIIDDVVLWSNMNVELYPNQNIVITDNGFLTLNNTKLTLIGTNAYNTFCSSDINDYWGGILIEGGDAGGSIAQGPGGVIIYSYPTGAIEVKNNSIIEFSSLGIKAPSTFGLIRLDNSTMINNLTCIDAFEDRASVSALQPCSYQNNIGRVFIENNSLIELPDASHIYHSPQIRVVGTSIKIDDSDIINKSNQSISAVVSMLGQLRVQNSSKVNGFDIGLRKDVDDLNLCNPRGLIIQNSVIKSNEMSIVNRSQFANIESNYIEGDIFFEGKCSGKMVSNNIQNDCNLVNLGSDQADQRDNSFLIRENYFAKDGVAITLNDNNNYTYAECNTFDADGTPLHLAVQVNGMIIDNWGTEDQPSGNMHVNAPDLPIMASERYKIVNYHEDGVSNQTFNTISSKFEMLGIQGVSADCDYTSHPIDENDITTEPTTRSLAELDSLWINLNLQISSLYSSLDTLTGDALKRQKEEINYLEVFRSSILSSAILQLSASHAGDTANTWRNRISSKWINQHNIVDFLITEQYSSVDSSLQSYMEVDSIDMDDIVVFEDIISWLDELKSKGKSLFMLPDEQVDTLVQFCTSSFGNYTNLFRSILSSYYNIIIVEDTFESNLRYENANPEVSSVDNNDYEITLYPNPTSGNCFSMHVPQEVDMENLLVSVIDTNGRKVFQSSNILSNTICLNNYNLDRGIYFIKILNLANGTNSVHKLILN